MMLSNGWNWVSIKTINSFLNSDLIKLAIALLYPPSRVCAYQPWLGAARIRAANGGRRRGLWRPDVYEVNARSGVLFISFPHFSHLVSCSSVASVQAALSFAASSQLPVELCHAATFG